MSDRKDDQGPAELTPIERAALALGRFTNERDVPKRLQTAFLRSVSYAWVRPALSRRVLADGLRELYDLRPERGVLLVSNHRSFFDQYILLLANWMSPITWAQRLYFPVRSNFFYDNPAGMLVNYAVGGGVMYPPIYRHKERRELNDDALDRAIEFLQHPGSLVGIHPEGTRGKGPDPYQLLPAQPGVGKVALLAQPTVIPAFINGLGNDVLADVRRTYSKDSRRTHPVIIAMGQPLDLSEFAGQKPRPTLYKKAADRFMAAIAALGARERELRAACAAGEISDDDPRWADNLRRP
ncbi:MAG: lysophospholipid acyltransferase family protein [Kofleriaceae bacterium]